MKSKKTIYIILTFFISIGVFALYQVLSITNEYRRSSKTYDNIKEYVDKNLENEQSNEEKIIEVDFTSLKNINSDIVAWIHMEDLNISYPVVQGSDNDYYLNHMIDKNYNSAGSIFLDYRNNKDLTSKHSIIYGHNMANGTMFADLTKYKDKNYYNEHPSYMLITQEKNYKVEIISGYVANVKEDSWKLEFNNAEEFSLWLNWTKEKSYFQSSTIPYFEEHIITLSTCSNESNNTRFVLVGVLKEF